MLPDSIRNKIQEELDEEITDFKSVPGGDINEAGKIVLETDKKYFIKWNESTPEDMFTVEAKGLELLASAETNLEIPKVILESDDFLLLSLITEGGGKQGSASDFGEDLAKLHQKTNKEFGINYDNYIGRLPQSNTQHENWPDFFAIERIEPQIQMGVESGKLTRTVLKSVENMYQKFGSVFPEEKPSLLHGDLWSGNYMFTKTGGTSIYDPAVYYGHREIELSMTRLFGGFSADFYDGYNEASPLEPGFDERVTLYNLYPILVHANLFGGSYCRRAEDIIEAYS